MKKKSENETPSRKKAVNTKGAGNVGAHGSKAQPKAESHAPKWPGGGKKGEDE